MCWCYIDYWQEDYLRNKCREWTYTFMLCANTIQNS